MRPETPHSLRTDSALVSRSCTPRGQVVLTFEHSRIDSLVAERLRRVLRSQVSEALADGTQEVVLDMRNVDFIDSRGLWVLTSVWRLIASSPTNRLSVVRCKDPLKRFLANCRVDRVLNVRNDQRDAAMDTPRPG